MNRSLLVCTLTQHWAQLISRLVPSSAIWGLESCPSAASFVLLDWVLKHISGIRGLDHWRPPGRFTNIKLEFSSLDSVYWQEVRFKEQNPDVYYNAVSDICFIKIRRSCDTLHPPNRSENLINISVVNYITEHHLVALLTRLSGINCRNLSHYIYTTLS